MLARFRSRTIRGKCAHQSVIKSIKSGMPSGQAACRTRSGSWSRSAICYLSSDPDELHTLEGSKAGSLAILWSAGSFFPEGADYNGRPPADMRSWKELETRVMAVVTFERLRKPEMTPKAES